MSEAEGTGLEPATPVKGHLISSEAANQFAYPPKMQPDYPEPLMSLMNSSLELNLPNFAVSCSMAST